MIHLIFLIYEILICKFSNSPKSIFKIDQSQSTWAALPSSFKTMHRIAKIISCLTCMFPSKVEQGDVFPSCFSSDTVNKCAFHGLFGFSHISTFCLCIYCLIQLLVIVGLLSSVPKYKKVVMCPTGEIVR